MSRKVGSLHDVAEKRIVGTSDFLGCVDLERRRGELGVLEFIFSSPEPEGDDDVREHVFHGDVVLRSGDRQTCLLIRGWQEVDDAVPELCRKLLFHHLPVTVADDESQEFQEWVAQAGSSKHRHHSL